MQVTRGDCMNAAAGVGPSSACHDLSTSWENIQIQENECFATMSNESIDS